MKRVADRGKLWARLLLVGVTGAVPLFAVALFQIHTTYSAEVAFSEQERRGLAFLNRLDVVYELLSSYTSTAAGVHAGVDRAATSTDWKHQVETALAALARDFEGELGTHLGFDEATLLASGREDARLATLRQRWAALEAAQGTELVLRTREVVASVRSIIEHTADRSNLILDPNLDTYYLMDVVVLAVPQALGRIVEVEASLSETEETHWGARDVRFVVQAALLRDADLARIQRSAARALKEDAAFHGQSPTLQSRLPSAVSAYATAVQALLRRLDTAAVPSSELRVACAEARTAGFELLRVGGSELDQLLVARLDDILQRRATAYALIIATLLGAAAAMAWLIRGLLIAHDVAARRSQEVLGAKEAQVRALGDNLPGGMTYQVMRERDGAMRFLYVSAGVKTIHGVTADAVLANPAELYELLLPEDRPALLAKEQESLAHMTPFKALARSRRKHDGAVRWLEFASAPRLLPDGCVVWDGIQMDVTERHLAEVTARHTQQRFSQIFDHSPIPISLSRLATGTFEAVNENFLKFSGYSRAEIVGHHSIELNLYADPSQRASLLDRLRADGYLHGVEVAFRTKTGKVRDSLLWLELITIDDERYVLAMSLDTTEQTEAHQQQRELEEQLRQAQKLDALGTLAGGIAHDFNNILGAIVVYTELSKADNPDNPQLVENLNEILQASQRAAVLARQILSFSRRQKEERTTLQLGPIVKEALSLLRATLPATIAIERALGEAPPVLANATQVHQIVMNLCTNAAHAMKGVQGKLDVQLSTVILGEADSLPHVELGPGRYALLTISDTGHGMDAATKGRIFDPFFTTKRAGEGTGLGLSVVHGIVREYGGVITVQSEVGRGTTFAVYLPADAENAEPAAAPFADVPRGRGERILLVDDEAALGKAMALMLRRLGYTPALFNRPTAALSAFLQAPTNYDAVLTDLTMPDLTGVDLIRQVRAVRPEIPTILVSGSEGSILQAELRDLGLEEVLTKPLAYRTLAFALGRALPPTSAREPPPLAED